MDLVKSVDEETMDEDLDFLGCEDVYGAFPFAF